MRRQLCGSLLWILALPAPGEGIDAATAVSAFAERQALCDRDHGALWGRGLCGPLLLIDPASRNLIATQDTPRGSLRKQGQVFVGQLPDGVLVANTAVDWEGLRWSMVESPLPDQQLVRETLLIHESWHRIQDSLGLPLRSPTAAHLATAFGRTTLRLEWRALAAALSTPADRERRAAIRDALLFRSWRRRETRGAAAPENQLELNEGLAEYTGRKLSGQSAVAIAAALAEAEQHTSFARNFAYASGPAYGYLLDLYSTRWRAQLTADSNLAFMLAAAADITLPSEIGRSAQEAGARYGLAQVDKEERAAAYERGLQAKQWTRRLVSGPVLHFNFSRMKLQFNPNDVFPLPPYGTVYPTLQVIDTWGTLKVEDGALVDEKWTGVTVSAPRPGAKNGEGWTLQLNPGWGVRPGSRPNDFQIAREK